MKRTSLIQTLIALVPLTLLLGCSNPARDVPTAAAEKPSDPATNTAASSEVEANYFVLTPTNSAIAFTGSKVTRSHNGGFKNFVGELKVVNGRLAGAGNKVVIDTSSVYADDPRLTGHLKSPDFFSVAQYPTATFVTTAIEEKATNSTVTGDLTLHGVTKSISFPAKIKLSEEAASVTGIFAIKRADFDIK